MSDSDAATPGEERPRWRNPALPVTTWLAVLAALALIVFEGTRVIPLIAAKPPASPKPPANVAPQTTAKPAGNTGLLMTVYRGRNFERPLFSRIYEGDLRFPLNNEMGPGADQTDMSIELTGMLKISQRGDYQFVAYCDDGARIWIDDKLVVNAWPKETLPGLVLPPIALTPGNVPVRIEVNNAEGPGWIALEWYGPGFPKRVLTSKDFVPNVVKAPAGQ